MPIPDAEVVAELTVGGQAVADFFLLDGVVCHANPRGEWMALSIDDPELAAATRAYLRRVGAREFGSHAEFQAWRAGVESSSGVDPAL